MKGEDKIMRSNQVTGLPMKAFLFLAFFLALTAPGPAACQTYEFDEGLKVLTSGLIAKKEDFLKNKKIAVFGIVETKTSEPWEITTHIEDGIVDILVNEGFTVVERRRIEDVLKKEIKKSADLFFDEAQVAQFGKLVGAEIVVTGKFSRWGKNILRINIRGITVNDGKVIAASKVNVHTDRIEDLLTPEKKADRGEDKGGKEPQGKTQEAPLPKASDQPPKAQQPPYQQQPQYQYQQPQYQQQYPSPPQGQPAPPSYPAAPEYGYFCCDQFGVRRCQLIQPVPVGSPCFCPGQGWGYACQ
jgi:hypothetical protein